MVGNNTTTKLEGSYSLAYGKGIHYYILMARSEEDLVIESQKLGGPLQFSGV